MPTTDRFGMSIGPAMVALMERAQAANASRDKIDGIPMHMTPILDQLRTAAIAIATGCNIRDWECAAEGLDMLTTAISLMETTKRTKGCT